MTYIISPRSYFFSAAVIQLMRFYCIYCFFFVGLNTKAPNSLTTFNFFGLFFFIPRELYNFILLILFKLILNHNNKDKLNSFYIISKYHSQFIELWGLVCIRQSRGKVDALKRGKLLKWFCVRILFGVFWENMFLA